MPAQPPTPPRFERLQRAPERSSGSILGLLASLAAILGILVGVVFFREVERVDADQAPRMHMAAAPEADPVPSAPPPSPPPPDRVPERAPPPPPPTSEPVEQQAQAVAPTPSRRAPRVGRTSWLQSHRGYETAMAERDATGWPVLVYVSTTWCPYCRELDANLWRNGQVDRYIAGAFIRVHIDPDTTPTDAALVRALGVDGFPAILVLRPATTQFARVSGQESAGRARSAASFIADLRRFE